MTSSSLLGCLTITKCKNRDIDLKFCMHVFVRGVMTIIPFFDDLKVLNFIGIYFCKIKILGFEVKIKKKTKMRESHFLQHSILRV